MRQMVFRPNDDYTSILTLSEIEEMPPFEMEYYYLLINNCIKTNEENKRK